MLTKYFSYYYGESPIDWWDGWVSFKEFFYKHSHEPTKFNHGEGTSWTVRELSERYIEACDLAKEKGWEGDGQFMVTVLPVYNGSPGLVFAVKQENNGSTYVCSELPLRYLSDCE